MNENEEAPPEEPEDRFASGAVKPALAEPEGKTIG
jgi:hypothetical protein